MAPDTSVPMLRTTHRARAVLAGALAALSFAAGGCWRTNRLPPVDAGADAVVTDAFAPDDLADAAPLDGGVEDAGPSCVSEPEVCNLRDDDFDGRVDEEPEASTWCGARCGVDVCPRARSVAPLSGSLLTSRRPTFRWALEGGADGGRVEVCRDRACSAPLFVLVGATEATPIEPLPRGVVFWRMVPTRGGLELPAVGAPWIAHVPEYGRTLDRVTGSVLDVNADGSADVLARGRAADGSRRWSIFLRRALGDAIATSLPAAAEVEATGDFDGDGRADLLVSSTGSARGPFVVFSGTATGLSSGASLPDTTPSPVRTIGADFDGDGYADVLTRVGILRGGPRGLDGATTPFPLPAYGEPEFGSEAWSIGDVDGDGVSDIALGQHCDESVPPTPARCPADTTLWRANLRAAPGRWTPRPPEGPGVLVGVGDIDGDSILDHVVWTAGLVSPPWFAYLLRASDAAPAVSGWQEVAGVPDPILGDLVSDVPLGPACDVDGDGYGDVVFRRDGATILRNGGPSGWSDAAVPLTDTPAHAATCLGDEDGDGYADVAVYVIPGPADGPAEVRIYRGGPGGLDPDAFEVLHVERAMAGARSSPSLF